MAKPERFPGSTEGVEPKPKPHTPHRTIHEIENQKKGGGACAIKFHWLIIITTIKYVYVVCAPVVSLSPHRSMYRWFVSTNKLFPKKIGRYPTGSGARTVVARLPLAPASGRRRGPPRRASRERPYHEALPPCAHSLFQPLFESPTRRPKSSEWDSQWDLRSAQWEVAAFPVGKVQAPTGKSQPAEWEGAGSHWEVTRAVCVQPGVLRFRFPGTTS